MHLALPVLKAPSFPLQYNNFLLLATRHFSCESLDACPVYLSMLKLPNFCTTRSKFFFNLVVTPTIESSGPLFVGLFPVARWEVLTTVLLVQDFCQLAALLTRPRRSANEAFSCIFSFCLAFWLPLAVVSRV